MRHRSMSALLLVLALAALAHNATAQRLRFEDNFTSLRPSPYDANSSWTYSYLIANPFLSNAQFSAIRGGGTLFTLNPFNLTTVDALDHLKSLIFIKRSVFDPNATNVVGRKLRYTANVAVKLSRTNASPFPTRLVSRRNDDPRMGVCGMSMDDLIAGVGTNIVMTDTSIFAVYAILPFYKSPTNNYGAFFQFKYLGARTAKDVKELAIEYDPVASTITYFVSGAVQWVVSRPGYKQSGPGVVTMVDWGGVERPIAMQGPQLLFDGGFGCFTILDGLDYWAPDPAKGLVGLFPTPVVPTTFYDNGGMTGALASSRLWGQGANFTLKRYRVHVT